MLPFSTKVKVKVINSPYFVDIQALSIPHHIQTEQDISHLTINTAPCLYSDHTALDNCFHSNQDNNLKNIQNKTYCISNG